MTNSTGAFLALALCLLGACRDEVPAKVEAEQAPAPTNRIDVPEAVRRNLGIEFVRVERRRVAQTLRVPGHFELLPLARHQHRVPLGGRVEVLVQPLQTVQAGDLLYRIESPEWRRLQRELGELATAVVVGQARSAAMQPLALAHRTHEASVREAMAVMSARIESIEKTAADVGGQAQELATARVQLAQMQAQLAEAGEKHAETEALLAELAANLGASQERYRLALEAAATVTGLPVENLERVEGTVGRLPHWRRLAAIEVRATVAGLVDDLPVATGVWVETGDLVLTITDVAQVRFRAHALQSDLPRLHAGLPARIVLPQGSAALGTSLAGTLTFGIEADPVQRTIDLFVRPEDVGSDVTWARPGFAAFLEIETAGGAAPELCIPLAAVLQDGLHKVFFRRDPKDKDKVIRVEADLGLDDGRWVEVKSGLRDDDEVVLAGVYELMLASSGTATKGGHFHADGTFHADEHK